MARWQVSRSRLDRAGVTVAVKGGCAMSSVNATPESFPASDLGELEAKSADLTWSLLMDLMTVLLQSKLELRKLKHQLQEQKVELKAEEIQLAADKIEAAAQMALAAGVVSGASIQVMGAVSAVAAVSKGTAGATTMTPTTPTAPTAQVKQVEVQRQAIDRLIGQQKQTLDTMVKSGMQLRTGTLQERQSKMLEALKQLQAKHAEIMKLTL
jgi:hypothetical protein